MFAIIDKEQCSGRQVFWSAWLALNDDIAHLKDAGRVLMRFNELRKALQLRFSGELTRFTDDELKAVVGLLSGPGVVWELKFGSWVLLQPGRINAYAQAVIQAMRAGATSCPLQLN